MRWEGRLGRGAGDKAHSSGLRGHNDDQIRPLKPDDRPEMTKGNARWETKEEDVLTKNKGDWGSRIGWDVSGSVWELGERLTLK